MKVDDVEFNVPFEIRNGEVFLVLANATPPSVYNDPDDDIRIDGEGWLALTGYSGQWGYRGAVMHPSEFIGGGLERDILANPGIYVVTEVLDSPWPGRWQSAIGWVVLRKEN